MSEAWIDRLIMAGVIVLGLIMVVVCVAIYAMCEGVWWL